MLEAAQEVAAARIAQVPGIVVAVGTLEIGLLLFDGGYESGQAPPGGRGDAGQETQHRLASLARIILPVALGAQAGQHAQLVESGALQPGAHQLGQRLAAAGFQELTGRLRLRNCRGIQQPGSRQQRLQRGGRQREGVERIGFCLQRQAHAQRGQQGAGMLQQAVLRREGQGAFGRQGGASQRGAGRLARRRQAAQQVIRDIGVLFWPIGCIEECPPDQAAVPQHLGG